MVLVDEGGACLNELCMCMEVASERLYVLPCYACLSLSLSVCMCASSACPLLLPDSEQ